METKHILCPVDFGSLTEKAARNAVSIAQKTGASVTLLHVHAVPIYATASGGVAPTPTMLSDTSDELQRSLDQLKDKLTTGEVELNTRLVMGRDSIAGTVLEVAKEIGADLVVMGSHGRSGIARFVLGSVAEQVIRNTDIPVLITPDTE